MDDCKAQAIFFPPLNLVLFTFNPFLESCQALEDRVRWR